jgi:hypothetical protein
MKPAEELAEQLVGRMVLGKWSMAICQSAPSKPSLRFLVSLIKLAKKTILLLN